MKQTDEKGRPLTHWGGLEALKPNPLLIDEIGHWNFTKAEQKQHIIEIMKGDEELGLYEEPKQHIELINNNIEEFDKAIELFKQETTLEEVLIFPIMIENGLDYLRLSRKIFDKGAKYQQDKLCNSEVIQRIRASKSDAEARRIIRTI